MGYLNTYIVPTAFTVFLHAIVIFFVLVGWQMSDTHRFKVDTPRYVKAELVTLEQKKPKAEEKKSAAPKPAKKPAPPPKAEPVEQKAAPKPAPKVEPEPAPQPVVPPKPRAEEPKPDPEAERRKQRAEERAQQQADLLRALEEEESLMQAEEDEIAAESYANLIKRTVEGYWSRPPSARKDMEVVLSIRMIPTGDVVGVEVVKSSGNAAFDRSAIQAVEKAARFPELKDMSPTVFEAYFRQFTLVFKPEDLLL